MASCGKNPFARMDKRVTLQSVSRSADGQGGFTESWTTIATVWASIEPVKGYEKFQALQLATPVTHRVTCRYRSDLTTATRLLYGARVFDVKEAINDNESGALLRLTCLELQ